MDDYKRAMLYCACIYVFIDAMRDITQRIVYLRRLTR